MICVEVSRKFPKNGNLFEKNTSTQGRKFRKYFYTGALTPSPKIPLIRIRDGIGRGQRPKGGGAIWRSVTHFSAPKAPKNGNFWNILGINWVK